MRTFIADEPFVPVERPQPSSDTDSALPAQYQPLGLLIIGLIFIAIAIWVLIGVDGANRLFGTFASGASGVLALAAARASRQQQGRPLKPIGNQAMMAAGSLALILLTGESVREAGFSGSTGIGLFTLAWIALNIYIAARASRASQVAALMRGTLAPAPLTVASTPSSTSVSPVASTSSNARASPDTSAPPTAAPQPRIAPPIRIDIYLEDELPALPSPYLTPVGADRNIIGLPPRRILYLYNFFSSESLMQKVKGNWRRFGPVYFLGSPADFSYSHSFDRHVSETVGSTILATPESFDARLEAASEAVLPPGDKSLTDVSHLSGGYPQHLFLCKDGSWQHGVEKLFAHADVVMLDACDYEPQRAGLNWEIGHLVNRKALRDVVVLVDKTTDQPALCKAFREAWQSMDGASPNNGPDPGPVRWVLLESPGDRVPSPGQAHSLPPEADPFELYPKLNPVIRQLVIGHYRDALIEDRIFGLLI